jgi:hypothetical protein
MKWSFVGRGPAALTARYDAFMSYCHAGNGGVVPFLQDWLERFATPWYKPRSLRIFRDYTSLSASGDVRAAIEQALAAADWLIVLASPEASASPWVDREVGWWRANRLASRVLIVILSGELSWDEDAGDWSHSTPSFPLPPSARGMFRQEPLWVDLSTIQRPEQVDRANPELANRVAQLAAPLRGIDKDSLVGQHITYHRRARRERRGAISVLAVLVVLSLIAATVAVRQGNRAQLQTMAALSRQLVAQATSLEDSQPDVARQLLVEAYRLAPTDQATGALLASRVIPRVMPAPGASDVKFSPSLNFLAVATNHGVRLYDLGGGGPMSLLSNAFSGQAVEAAFTSDGRWLVVRGARDQIHLIDVRSPRSPVLVGTVVIPGMELSA